MICTEKLIIVGGGAAGMMAAISAAQEGANVTLIEQNDKMGRKLYITGKGRCNVTNHCSAQEFLKNVISNEKFLYSAIMQTPPQWIEDFFQNQGVDLKVERGNRVFPQSDRAADIIDALFLAMRRLKVNIVKDRVTEVLTQDGKISGVKGEKNLYAGKAVLIATGGASYPATGSTGDGYQFAAALGHKIVAPQGSLVPLVSKNDVCSKMQGLSLKNVTLTVKHTQTGKLIFSSQGEMLFTHFGISGPLVLSASASMRDADASVYSAEINLKPALDESALDARLLRELDEGKNKELSSILATLLPRAMVSVFMDLLQISPHKKGNEITKTQRKEILTLLQHFPVPIAQKRPLAEAIITAGGISVSQVNPKTLESKCVKGLFFAGEILDVDALTGGFNLQIAWSTGRLAGLSAAQFCIES